MNKLRQIERSQRFTSVPGARAPLRADELGVIALEYLLVVVFAGIAIVIAVAPILGPAITGEYKARRAIVYSTYP
jgi:Flp pilus assembly pilin Flp